MDFPALCSQQQEYFASGATRPLAFRLQQLRILAQGLEQHADLLAQAIRRDLGKPDQEIYLAEIGYVAAEIRHAVRNLKKWSKPRSAKVPMMARPGHSVVRAEPLGRTLIIGSWNYPVQFTLLPLVSSIAAGNCAIVKPSELAPATSAALSAMLRSLFPANYIAVAEGGREVAEALLEQKCDLIFYTGSATVGRKIMAAAAVHLTPVILELGGKCPVIVCRDANLKVAARRILWGKTLNAGQACVAPDYVLVDQSVMAPLITEMKAALREFFGENPQSSPDLGRIINDRHFQRLKALLGGGTVAAGGQMDETARYMAPTILTEVNLDSAVMQEEIFGPILPVIPFRSLDEVESLLRRHPDPLAMYVFSRDAAVQQRFLTGPRCGGVCFNDVVLHMMSPDAPFGGIGASGIGSYHGEAGFRAFSHLRTVLCRPAGWEFGMRFPPAKVSLQRFKKLLPMLFGR